MVPHTWRILGGLLVFTTMSRPLGAQRPFTVDIGLTAAHFTDDDASVFGPSLRLSAAGVRGRLFGSAEGGVLGTFGAASGFATLEGGVRSAVRGGWSTELAGELVSVAGSSSSGDAGTALIGGRALWRTSGVGTWLRASGHASAHASTSLTGGGLDAGARWYFARAQLTAMVTQEWTRAELFTGRFRTGFTGTTPVRYTEGAVALHTEGDRASLDLAASTRRDTDARRLFEQSLNATAAYWPRESMAFVFSVTRQLPDWVRRSDAVDAVTVGVRFGQAAPATARSAGFIPLVQVSDSGGARVMRVRVAGARQVEVMGDFTDWEARPLMQRGTVFERAMTLSSGTHLMLVRIDGGAWRTAANTPAVDDDLGGRAGLLVVP